jgi:hypothetical protein
MHGYIYIKVNCIINIERKKYNTNKDKEEEAMFCFNEKKKLDAFFNIVKAKEKGSHIRKKK